MKIIQDVLAELFSMFMTDARMSLSALILVGVVAALLNYAAITPVLAGAILLLGSLVIVVEAAVRDARKRAAAKGK